MLKVMRFLFIIFLVSIFSYQSKAQIDPDWIIEEWHNNLPPGSVPGEPYTDDSTPYGDSGSGFCEVNELFTLYGEGGNLKFEVLVKIKREFNNGIVLPSFQILSETLTILNSEVTNTSSIAYISSPGVLFMQCEYCIGCDDPQGEGNIYENHDYKVLESNCY